MGGIFAAYSGQKNDCAFTLVLIAFVYSEASLSVVLLFYVFNEGEVQVGATSECEGHDGIKVLVCFEGSEGGGA